jgi:hypothetical protein
VDHGAHLVDRYRIPWELDEPPGGACCGVWRRIAAGREGDDDVGNAVARRFGLVYEVQDEIIEIYRGIGRMLPEINGVSGAWELPLPGTFVVDQTGVVRLASVNADHTTRLDPERILHCLHELRAGRELAGPRAPPRHRLVPQ